MDSKSFLQSKTLWALLVAGLAWAIQKFHLFGGDAAQAAPVLDSLLNFCEVTGMAAAVYGRFVAKQPLHVTPPTPPDDSGGTGTGGIGVAGKVGMFLVACLLLTVLPGCPGVAATPAAPDLGAIVNLQTLLIGAEFTVEELHATGRISDKTYLDLRAVEDQAFTALNEAATAAKDGVPLTVQQKTEIARGFLKTLNDAILRNNPPPPATRPG